jgi:hypothetical protein
MHGFEIIVRVMTSLASLLCVLRAFKLLSFSHIHDSGQCSKRGLVLCNNRRNFQQTYCTNGTIIIHIKWLFKCSTVFNCTTDRWAHYRYFDHLKIRFLPVREALGSRIPGFRWPTFRHFGGLKVRFVACRENAILQVTLDTRIKGICLPWRYFSANIKSPRFAGRETRVSRVLVFLWETLRQFDGPSVQG